MWVIWKHFYDSLRSLRGDGMMIVDTLPVDDWLVGRLNWSFSSFTNLWSYFPWHHSYTRNIQKIHCAEALSVSQTRILPKKVLDLVENPKETRTKARAINHPISSLINVSNHLITPWSQKTALQPRPKLEAAPGCRWREIPPLRVQKHCWPVKKVSELPRINLCWESGQVRSLPSRQAVFTFIWNLEQKLVPWVKVSRTLPLNWTAHRRTITLGD